MELFTLDENFQPKTLVQTYDSLIWTERFKTNGDFQLTSSNVAECLRVLPNETYVTLRDSTVVMKAEFSKIEEQDEAGDLITITGRSFDVTSLELRASLKTASQGLGETTYLLPWNMSASKPSDAAYRVIRTVIGDDARSIGDVVVLPACEPSVSELDAIPEIDLVIPADYSIPKWSTTNLYFKGDMVIHETTLYTSLVDANSGVDPSTDVTKWAPSGTAPGELKTEDTKTYNIKTGNLYSTISDMLAVNNHGIKSIRPGIGGSKVGLEIYVGTDRRQQVIYDARLDQMSDQTYLLGKAGSTNIAYVFGKASPGVGSKQVDKNSGSDYEEPSGLNRRVLFLDETQEETVDGQDDLNSRGLVALYQNNDTALFGGQAADVVSKGYNQKYFLGDIITLQGKYGLSQYVQTTEFIRSIDSSGEKAYPTFEAVTP